MARLPTPGSDDGTWGNILNDFLSQEHNADGTQKTLPIAKGGTGATDAATARTNLIPDGIYLQFLQGIDKTGVVDATVAFQAEIDRVAAAGGGTIRPPFGNYLISSTLQMKSKVTLDFGGSWSVTGATSSGVPTYVGSTVKLANNSNVDMVQFGSAVTSARLKGVALLGNQASQTSGNGVRFIGAAGLPRSGNWLDTVYVTQAKNDGILVDPTHYEVRMREILVIQCGGHGLNIGGEDCYLDLIVTGFNGGHGLFFNGTNTNSCTVLSVDSFYNTLSGIHANGSQYMRAWNLHTNGNKQDGVWLKDCQFCKFTTIVSEGNSLESSTSGLHYASLHLSHSSAGMNGMTFSGCQFQGTTGNEAYGIYDDSPVPVKATAFTGCTFISPFATDLLNLTGFYDMIGCQGVGNFLQTHGTGLIGLVVRGLTGQSTNVFEIQQDGGVRVASINSSGKLTLGGATVLNAARLVSVTSAPSQIAIAAQGSVSQTGDLIQAVTVANSVVAGITAGGRAYGNDGITTKTKAGIPTDADFAAVPPDGTIAVDTTNSKLYVRIGGTWKSVTVA